MAEGDIDWEKLEDEDTLMDSSSPLQDFPMPSDDTSRPLPLHQEASVSSGGSRGGLFHHRALGADGGGAYRRCVLGAAGVRVL